MPPQIVILIPFPNLPLPAKFSKIKHAAEPVPIQPPPSTPALKKQSQHDRIKDHIEVPTPIIGGELSPEPQQKQDKGDHIVEEINYSDY